MSPSVLFFHIGSNAYGGGSQMVARLIRSLDRERFDPIVLTQQRDPFVEAIENHVATVEKVPFRGTLDTYRGQLLSPNLTTLITTAGRLLQFNVEAHGVLVDVDVAWCHNIRAVLTLGPQLRARRIPTIWNIGLGQSSEGAYYWLNEAGLRLSTVVFAESNAQLKDMFTEAQVDRHASKFVTFHKGIDTNRYVPKEGNFANSVMHVGTAAVLSPRKGIGDFLRAAAKVLSERGDVIFHIAGTEAAENEGYEGELREIAADLEIADAVIFHGWIEEMPDYLNSLDIFVLGSYAEGIPGSVREALATGTPVVATDVGETSEVVHDGETGLLVEPGNPPELAEAISKLLADPDTRERMGDRGRKLIVREHSIDRFVARYEKMLEWLDSDRPPDDLYV